ncbi:MAG: DUF3887 domain-containing protein [Bacteroidia bacterium]|nr:DUF3887 domain-containing protein [Bacteroidia bacterium]HQV00265.1 DUF3887 domain-containing protein [Bacteroidia bacterium]
MTFRKIIKLAALFVFVTLTTNAQPDSAKAIQTAQTFLDNLKAGQYLSCIKDFDWNLAGKVNTTALQNIWESLQKQQGKLLHTGAPYLVADSAYQTIYQLCSFEKGKLDLKITTNSNYKIAGLFFVPPVSRLSYTLPDYAIADNVLETSLEIKNGNYTLPAKLTYPKSGSKFPVVILVHGSGPNDMDETIGPNKIFKDIAYGLATKGVAVLRYTKRTKMYAAQLDVNKLTLQQEVIDDAVAAVAVAKSVVAVDPQRIFICGHSLGGSCAPAIALKSNNKAGIILMAAAARPLEDVALEQLKYLSDNSAEYLRKIEDFKVQASNVKLLDSTSDMESFMLPFGLPQSYWLSVKNNKPAEEVKNYNGRILLLQGQRDYQVTLADFTLWQTALRNNSKAQTRLYPTLNHLFMDGQGKSKPDEYNLPGHVSAQVIADIAQFCLQ